MKKLSKILFAATIVSISFLLAPALSFADATCSGSMCSIPKSATPDQPVNF